MDPEGAWFRMVSQVLKQVIFLFLLQWVGSRAPQRLASCGICLPSYGSTLENLIPDVDGIDFSFFMGAASPLVINLEM